MLNSLAPATNTHTQRYARNLPAGGRLPESSGQTRHVAGRDVIAGAEGAHPAPRPSGDDVFEHGVESVGDLVGVEAAKEDAFLEPHAVTIGLPPR